LERDPLKRYKMTQIEKSLLWSEREKLVDDSSTLSKLMLAVDWSIPAKRDAALKLLERYSVPSPIMALELLGPTFNEYRLREFAVKCLEPFDDDELSEFLLQLVQALKYEAAHDSPLARFLLKRALGNSREIGTKLFWCLRSEMHLLNYASRFGLMLQSYLKNCGAHISELTQQHDLQEMLKGIASHAQQQSFKSKQDRNEYAREELTKVAAKLPKNFQVSLDPRIKARGFKISGCRVMGSKKKPLWLALENVDPGEGNILVMFKSGDDLRQDQLTLQLLRVMEKIWIVEGLNLRLTPYLCLSTGNETGFLQIVPNSDTTANIQKQIGGVVGAFRDNPLKDWLQQNNSVSMTNAISNFVHSTAGYVVACYVLGIGDRHSDNIMLRKDGHLFHIDFGHFLGNFKSKFGIKRERTAFVFTKEMLSVMGGKNSPEYKNFVEYCLEAFNILRLHADEMISLFRLMIPAGMPELQKAEDIQYLVDQLHLELSEKEANEVFKNEINKSLADNFRRFDNFIHNIKNA